MTFAAPLFLIAILAGIIPLLLHMINRQKARTMPFSTLRFLRISVQRTRRRKYVHDILLLLLRVAALMLIAIGLAKPTISRLGNLLGRRAASAVVLILDNSASMATSDEPGSRWEMALQASEQLLEQLGDEDSVALLLSCGPPRPELDRLYSNHEVVRQALDACQVSYEQANLVARLLTAEKLLHDSDAPNKEIYVVTDMQAVSWQSWRDDWQDASADPRQRPPVVLVDVHRAALPNVAIRQLQLHSAGPVAGVPMQAAVELLGDSDVEQSRHAELYLDGQLREVSPTLTLGPGGRAEHAFQFTIDQPGTHRGEIRLAGEDASALDDRRYFAITVDPHISVAVVKSADHAIPYLDDTYYLERALRPVSAGSWAIRTTTLSPGALAGERLSNYAVIYCVNLPALDPAAAGRLREYVRRGGHVVWICGDNVDPVLYSAMDEAANHELLPTRLLGVRQPTAESPDGWRIGWVDERHKAVGPFAQPASLHQSVLVYRHVQMAPLDGSDVRVLARLDDGDPLLVERSVGSGSLLLLATSAHVDWSNLPLRPMFLPLVARLTFYLANAEATQPQLAAGTPLVVPVAGGSPATVEIVRPSGEAVRIDAQDSEQAALRYTDTHDVGIYEVTLVDVGQRRQLAYALNLDPNETASALISADKLQARFGERPLLLCQDPTNLAETIRTLREGESLLELFLVGVLIALIAEAYVANRRVEQEQPEELRQPDRPGALRRRFPEKLDDLVVTRR